jgi:hypothetical protein
LQALAQHAVTNCVCILGLEFQRITLQQTHFNLRLS